MAQPLQLDVTLDAAEPDVWLAIADPLRRRAWWPYLDLEPNRGGRLVERWRDAEGRDVTTSGTVLEAEEPYRLRCTWRDEDWPDATEVEISLRPAGKATRLRLRHGGWERLGDRGVELRSAHRKGWEGHLVNLKRYVEDEAS